MKIIEPRQTKSAPHMEHFLTCYSIMVREIDASWNTTYDSILTIYKKLLDLGFEYRDGEILIQDGDSDEC